MRSRRHGVEKDRRALERRRVVLARRAFALRRHRVVGNAGFCCSGWRDHWSVFGIGVTRGHGPLERAGRGLSQVRECTVEGVFEQVVAPAHRAEVVMAGLAGWEASGVVEMAAGGRLVAAEEDTRLVAA